MVQRGSLDVRVASGDALEVRELTVRERLSSLFEVSLVVAAEDDLDLDAIVGQPAIFTLGGLPAPRSWIGIAAGLSQITAPDLGPSTYALEIAPVLWLAGHDRHRRVLQESSELAVALALLSEWGIVPELRLERTYESRPLHVQYDESDLAFLERVLARAEIAYWFEPRGAEMKLVLSDAPHARDPRPPIAFRERPSEADREHVTGVRVSRRIRPGDTLPVTVVDLASSALDLAPGTVTSLLEHPRADLGRGQRLLVVASTISGNHQDGYTIHCVAESTLAPHHPPRAIPGPRVQGVETAVVVGPPGEDTHLDHHGRIRVRFPWGGHPRADDDGSFWVQTSRGAGLPRVGEEVIVDFLGGDPDRPIVTGVVRGAGEARNDEDVTIPHDGTSTVGNDERRVTGQNLSLVVGVNRSSQVGLDDLTEVGHRHAVRIAGGTTAVMQHDRIELGTPGGAKITLEGGTISFEARQVVARTESQEGPVLLGAEPPGERS